MQRAYSDNPDYWGASISFWPLDGRMEKIAENVSVPMYTDGEFEEISILAEKDACCLFTALHSKERINRMKDELKAQIRLLVGEDEELANSIISQVDESNKTITENGLIRRQSEESPDPESEEVVEKDPEVEEDDSEEEEEEKVEDSISTDSIPPVIEIDEIVVDAIADKVLQSSQLSEISDSLKSLQKEVEELGKKLASETAEIIAASKKEGDLISERLSKLEVDEEEKRENWLNDMPKSSKTVVKYRPRTQSVEAEHEASFDEIASKTLENIK